jgi:hypothetical protein
VQASLPALSLKGEHASLKAQLTNAKHIIRAYALNASKMPGAPVKLLALHSDERNFLKELSLKIIKPVS